jgi:hypothetical protein
MLGPKRKDIRLTHAYGPPNAHGSQLTGLDVAADGDGMHAQPLGDFVYGEELAICVHRMLTIACVCMR